MITDDKSSLSPNISFKYWAIFFCCWILQWFSIESITGNLETNSPDIVITVLREKTRTAYHINGFKQFAFALSPVWKQTHFGRKDFAHELPNPCSVRIPRTVPAGISALSLPPYPLVHRVAKFETNDRQVWGTEKLAITLSSNAIPFCSLRLSRRRLLLCKPHTKSS